MNQPILLRRRSHVERRVLLMLRGADSDSASSKCLQRVKRNKIGVDAVTQLTPYFAELRTLTLGLGLRLQPVSASYVSIDEIRIIGWLAERQRVSSFSTLPRRHSDFADALERCSIALDKVGLRLPPITLYANRLHTAPKMDMGKI